MARWFRLLVLAGLFLFSAKFHAQTLTDKTFLVKGNCSMCKDRIESTAKRAGATQAVWSAETKQLTVNFDDAKTTAETILKEIAAVGHDNERFTAPDEVYKNLPSCCHYERTPSLIKTNSQDTAQYTRREYFVRGNCDQCKERIENAAKEAGATTAKWDAQLQKVFLDFDPEKVTTEQVLKKIAGVGHDNQMFKAPDEVYKNLPACCLYDRSTPLGILGEAVHADNTQETHSKKDFSNFEDHIDKQIEGVTVTKMQSPTAIDGKSTGLTFNIGQKELLKAACCNLSESFETNATVDVAYSNAVTGTKQLKMLGLDQKYTALTKDLLPEIRGLASAYGLNFIPGRWIGGIQLTKGGSTVTNGYESITGQINTELLKFNKKSETTLNLFADIDGRTEANITHTSSLTDKWKQSILLHGNATVVKKDYNDDGFMDQPTGTQLNMAYLMDYDDLQKSGWGSHFGINVLQDKRDAGQMDFNKALDQSEQAAYGVEIDISRFQVWNKTGYIFKGKPYQSIGLMNQLTYHQQDSFFGLRNYAGKQTTYYTNLIFESIFGNTNHKYKAGAGFLWDKFDEDYLNTNYRRTETVPGLFFEYTLTGLKYSLVAGTRVDFHNLAGTQFTPRINFKYDFTPKTILRLSAGRGFRTANIFAENQNFFASSRTVEITDNGGKIYGLKPEIAWNYGASLQQELKLFGRKSTIIADFFRTDFQDQVLADLDASPRKIVFYNLDGKSFANSFQTQWDFTPFKNFDVRLAYKYYAVQTDFAGGRREIPFMAKHRGFLNLAYSTTKKTNGSFWSFDTTLNVIGKQRLPETSSSSTEFQLPEYSNAYTQLSTQVARQFNEKLRIYLGGSNLTGYMQKNPIINAANPFENYFDGGMIYAPTMPATIYAGIDFKF